MAEPTVPTGAAGPDELNRLRVSPAAHLAADMAAASAASPAVALREIPFATLVGLRAVPGTASAQAVEAVLGCPLPTRVSQVTGGGEAGGNAAEGDTGGGAAEGKLGDPNGRRACRWEVLWLGPDEFLAVDVANQQVPGCADEFAAVLDGVPGQALDLSANRTVLELSGRHALDVLEKGCRADLHPREFPPGSAITTSIGPVPVVLQHVAVDADAAEGEGGAVGDQPGAPATGGVYRILPRASFADYMVRWLLDAMTEFNGVPLTAADFSGVGRREADRRLES